MIVALGILLFSVLGCAALFVDHSRAENVRLRLLVDLSERLLLSPGIEDAAGILPSFGRRLFPRLEGAVYVSRASTESVKLAATWGNRFLIVLANVTAEALRARALGLLERVRDLHVLCDGRLVTGITASAGIAISPHHSTNIEGLIAAADRALYAAKSAGRDRVATPPPQAVRRTAA